MANQHIASSVALAVPAGSATLESPILASTFGRLWVRRDPPLGFVWRGALPLVALLLLAWFAFAPFAKEDIEANVRRGVRQQLDDNGSKWAQLSVSGQEVRLTGVPLTPEAAGRALATARAAECPTWSGPRTCAVEVRGDFDAPPAEVAAVPVAAKEQPASAQACERTLAALLSESSIEFGTGSAAIVAGTAPLLDRLARAIGDCPSGIRIEGYTDSMGREAANQALSEARALAVQEALKVRGVPAEKISAQGFGATRPLADNGTAEGRRQNRRIEFKASL